MSCSVDIEENCTIILKCGMKDKAKKRPLETLQDGPVCDKQAKGALGKLTMSEHSAIHN
jgi:hypothetical protein